MASSSNQTMDRGGREKTADAEGATIWELGPVRSRMTQNALGDHFVDQFQDNSEKEPSTAFGDEESNVSGAQMPTLKIEPDNKSESSFGDYFKKTYTGSSNRITRTVTAIPDQKVSAATRLTQGELTGLGTTLNHPGELTGLGMCPRTLNPRDETTGLGNTLNHQGELTGLGMCPRTLNPRDETTGLGNTLNHQGELTGLGMCPRTLNHQGETTGMGTTLNHQGELTWLGMYLRSLKNQDEMMKMELEAQKRREAIEVEQLKQAMLKQYLARQAEDRTFDRLHKELTGLGTTLNDHGELTGLGMYLRTLNRQGETTGLGTTLNHQGELYGLGMYPRILNHGGVTHELGMYSRTMNHQENWLMRLMRGRCDRIEGIRPGSSASSLGMRGPTDMIQSRDDQFNFRMGLLERENLLPTSILQEDISNPMSGIVGPMTGGNREAEAEPEPATVRTSSENELEAQKRREADEMMKMELEAQKRREAIEADETMKLIQAEQLKQAMVNQDLARQAEENERGQQTLYGMVWHGGKSRQEDIDRLHKEVEMLKKQLSSKSPDHSALKSNNVPARYGVKSRLGVRSGVKSRLGVAARLGDPQELKKKKNRYRKKRKNGSHELPADLVLTELSDAGPVPAKASGAISPELSRVIPRELVLTEFGENVPVKVQTELEKLEARARKVSQIN